MYGAHVNVQLTDITILASDAELFCTAEGTKLTCIASVLLSICCRPFMGGPHMFEEDEQGRQGLRQDDSGSGDALAMGMDVDILAATTSGDRREEERRRGREGRYRKSGSCEGTSTLTSLQATSWQKPAPASNPKPVTHFA